MEARLRVNGGRRQAATRGRGGVAPGDRPARRQAGISRRCPNNGEQFGLPAGRGAGRRGPAAPQARLTVGDHGSFGRAAFRTEKSARYLRPTHETAGGRCHPTTPRRALSVCDGSVTASAGPAPSWRGMRDGGCPAPPSARDFAMPAGCWLAQDATSRERVSVSRGHADARPPSPPTVHLPLPSSAWRTVAAEPSQDHYGTWIAVVNALEPDRPGMAGPRRGSRIRLANSSLGCIRLSRAMARGLRRVDYPYRVTGGCAGSVRVAVPLRTALALAASAQDM
jgi:hypothetical protein